MRNRLNVMWCGKRTTARFPAYLWEMAMVALDLPDDSLADHIAQYLAREQENPALEFWPASRVVNNYLVMVVMQELRSDSQNRPPFV